MIPKLPYTLRTSPCFLSPYPYTYNQTLKSIVSTIANIHFVGDDKSWLQASLPVKYGDLGIQMAVQLAPDLPTWLQLLPPPSDSAISL